MEAYKKQHNGKGPATNDEYLGFLSAHHIALPDLPPGHRYAYDPDKERVTVEKDSN